MALTQTQLEYANSKAIQANAEAIQKAVGSMTTVLSGMTLNLNDDIGTKINKIAEALAKLGMTIVMSQPNSTES